jgi:glycosyltransferase involved in cell wall biosynthesis
MTESPLLVSTVLLTRNNAATLPAYFASMRDVDDIIVLDGGSTDATLEIARAQRNVRIFRQNPAFLDDDGRIIDFSSVRNEGYALARHPWILCVDADEEASPELLREVRRVVAEGRPGVYYVRRRFTHGGKPVVAFEKSVTDHVRLFHRSVVRGCVRPVHERLDVLPGAYRGMLGADVIVPILPAPVLRRKYDRFIEIEARANANISFRRWFRWILLRNTIAIIRRSLVSLLSRFIPRRGPRMPWSFDREQIRYSWLLMWRTMPRRTR